MDSNESYLKKLKSKRNDILLGEIAALLHDIGKCHPDFIKSHSIDSNELKHNNTPFKHHASDIDNIIKEVFESKEENTRKETGSDINNSNDKNNNSNNNVRDLMEFFDQEFNINNELKSSIDSIIKNHHSRENRNKLEKLLMVCDRLDSADDKGIVRQKQHSQNTVISTPFGYTKEKIELDFLKKCFKILAEKMIEVFQNYEKDKNIRTLRKEILNNVKDVFVHALGETRVPANDVSLWDHSYSTATIFKTELSRLALGEGYRAHNLSRRIFGICWNGERFINNGKKVADILVRKNIIEKIKRNIRKEFEVNYPLGNVIYEDINGIYITFPELDDYCKTKKIVRECAEKALYIIKVISKCEIWPFFTLSAPKQNLTVITDELKYAESMKKIPKMSPVIFIDNGSIERDKIWLEYMYQKGKADESNKVIWDICSVCKIRKKNEGDERCKYCKRRNETRIDKWLRNRRTTIWIDEIADVNNRYALLNLNFNLEKWLDGTMISTIFSQTYEDWFYGSRSKSKKNIEILYDFNTRQSLNPDLQTVYKILEIIINNRNNKEKALDTFFDENLGIKSDYRKHIKNIKERIAPAPFNEKNLAKYLFTQNASPARISRILREVEEFWETVLVQISEKIYPAPGSIWKRMKFSIDKDTLVLKNNETIDDYSRKPLIIKIENLEPENVHVLYDSCEGEFFSIESLEKFSYKNLKGAVAVKIALKEKCFNYLATEEKPDDNKLDVQNIQDIKIENLQLDDYIPVIELEKTPDSLRLLVPAYDSIKILQLVTELYNERFKKVIGKLPLNAGLLVANRKFPLYVMLETGERMLNRKEFKQPEYMEPWWDLSFVQNDRFYKYYPIRKSEEGHYTLDDLVPISKGQFYELYPGYFDFDLLSGTNDRYKINYSKDSRSRMGGDYTLLSARPLYFHQIAEIVELWEILKNNLSSSQLNFLEQVLMEKKKEWANVRDDEKSQVYRYFAEATLKEAFGGKWVELSEETKDLLKRAANNDLLLDTLTLFNHILKDREVN